MEPLSTLTRRQYEHRARIVSRLTAVLDADLQEMVLYNRAKALRDTGRAAQSRRRSESRLGRPTPTRVG
ncbi:hypothetical protein ACFRFU_34075 [Streptomyces sp. NPDC056704]|uniref:hypothetical protein n=1 Tax=Streptomyces sp. NPDC056704 TaxID=3345917 RepID=UPI003683C4B1